MNCDTGELIRLTKEEREAFFGEFKPVPKKHSEEADKLLGDQERVFADMAADTPLTNWAKSQQTHTGPNRKQRRRMAKLSRKQNRK